MAKEQQGIVIELNGQRAKVKVARHGDCENCGMCGGDSALVMEVNNMIGAKKGDKVAFEPREKGMLKAAFIVYVLPMISIFLGAWLGLIVSKQFNGPTTAFQVIGGIIAFVLSILFIYYYEKLSKSNVKRLPKITKVL